EGPRNPDVTLAALAEGDVLHEHDPEFRQLRRSEVPSSHRRWRWLDAEVRFHVRVRLSQLLVCLWRHLLVVAVAYVDRGFPSLEELLVVRRDLAVPHRGLEAGDEVVPKGVGPLRESRGPE